MAGALVTPGFGESRQHIFIEADSRVGDRVTHNDWDLYCCTFVGDANDRFSWRTRRDQTVFRHDCDLRRETLEHNVRCDIDAVCAGGRHKLCSIEPADQLNLRRLDTQCLSLIGADKFHAAAQNKACKHGKQSLHGAPKSQEAGNRNKAEGVAGGPFHQHLQSIGPFATFATSDRKSAAGLDIRATNVWTLRYASVTIDVPPECTPGRAAYRPRFLPEPALC